MHKKFNLKIQNGSEIKTKNSEIELLDNYGFSESNFKNNKSLSKNSYLQELNLKKKSEKNYINIIQKEIKDIKVEEDCIYIEEDNDNEIVLNEDDDIESIKEEIKEEQKNLDFFNLDLYKNTVFNLDKF